MTIEVSDIGEFAGETVRAFTIANGNGLSATLIEHGARLVAMRVPNLQGDVADVVPAAADLAGYEASFGSFGAICGRFANRIAHGRLTIDGTTHALARAAGAVHHLHGGPRGFHHRRWRGEGDRTANAVTFRLVSADGDQGYPGTLTVDTTYALGDDDRLTCTMTAVTDKPTVVNLTNHVYWNLAGHGAGSIADHLLTVDADRYTPTDADNIPTGQVADVAGTPFDFREAKPLGRDIGFSERGYDINLCLNGGRGSLREVAVLSHPPSRRGLTLSTSEPGLQVYTAGGFDGAQPGKDGARYAKFGAVALEPQTYPDAPNKPGFPTARLDPGQTYEHRIAWRFFTFGGGG